MKDYCPVCGQTFLYRNNKKAIDKFEKRFKKHKEKCFCPAWSSIGCKKIKNPKKDLSWMQSYWQIKRLVLIRDARKDGDNPWLWYPVCQSCGYISKHSVNANLNGTSDIEIHHIIPKQKGGLDVPENLLVLCHTCHRLTYKHNYAGIPNIRRKDQMILEI